MSLTLSEPFREVSCNVFVCTRGTPHDMALLHRFLNSLYASDFPKNHRLTVMGPGYNLDEARLVGALASVHGAEWVLMADTDTFVPPKWWVEMTKVLLAATPKPIGIVGPRIDGTKTHQRQGLQFNNPPDDMYELGVMDHDYLPYYTKGSPQYLFDGFVLFRSNFLSDTGKYPDAGIQWFVDTGKWCVMIANRVTVFHNKG